MMSESFPQTRMSFGSRALKFVKEQNLLFLFLTMVIIASFVSDRFLSPRNIFNLMQQSSISGVVAIGMTFVILLGGIDLAVGSVMAVCAMVVSIALMHWGWSIPLSVAIALLVGGFLGLISGLVVTIGKVPPFIATLATMVAARGLALLSTDGQPVFGLPQPFLFLGAGYIGPVPVAGIIWLLCTFIAGLVLRFTVFGRSLYAIGGNYEAARLSGIRTQFYTTLAYVVSGFTSALGGVLLASWLSVGQPTTGTGMELTAIAAVVLGGTSLSGGKGGMSGTLIGVLLLTIITNIFNLKGVSSYYQQIFMGAIIVVAVVLSKYLSVRTTR